MKKNLVAHTCEMIVHSFLHTAKTQVGLMQDRKKMEKNREGNPLRTGILRVWRQLTGQPQGLRPYSVLG